MTKIIAHRGNIFGPKKEKENHPDYITNAILEGYDVEVDLWRENNKWILGHDFPQYEIREEFLDKLTLGQYLWTHMKNGEALNYAFTNMKYKEWNYFWHQEDDFTLTSKGYIWTYPGKRLFQNSIAVMPECSNYNLESLKKCYAICTDKCTEYKEKLNG